VRLPARVHSRDPRQALAAKVLERWPLVR
jgi:hypothetical protein